MSPRVPALLACLAVTHAALAQVAPVPADRPADANETRLGKAEPPPIVLDVPLDDSVPLPGDGRDDGTKGEGDPYFLGFVGGSYYPPDGESVDPLLVSQVQIAPVDGRPEPTSFAFVMFERRITEARLEELRSLGCRVLGIHPHYCVKVALPPQQIDTVAALPYVRWIGAPRAAQKVHPDLVSSAASWPAGRPIDLVVSLYESDLGTESRRELIARAEQADAGDAPEVSVVDDERSAAYRWHSRGWQQRALEALGVEVLEYTESRSTIYFLARAPAASIEALAGLDFVAFVERRIEPEPMHVESTPMISSDAVRGGASGGASYAVTAGEIDSGISYTHYDITTHLNGLGWDFSGSPGGAWNDTCPHGTHVCGTFAGNGWVEARQKGNAPGLGWGATGRFFNGKIFNGCTGSVNLGNVMAVFRNGQFDGGGSFTPKPMVINNSWGGGGGAWIGSEAQCGLIDNEIFWQNQFYVFAAGNNAVTSSLSQEAGAKNSFAVGSVDDYVSWYGSPGERSSFSSQGPMGDSRWKPNVCAPGDWIRSTSNASTTGYYNDGGTSMAAPHVSGVAAQMLDNYPWMRYAPARTASVLMATAVTRGSQPITSHGTPGLNQYGAGRVDAYLANYGTATTGWSNWGFDLGAGQGTYADFYVGGGTTRVVVCMTWHEQGASVGASRAAINDWDLWLDYEPFSAGLNTGEYTAGLSSYDNTEIRYIDYPPVGWYRWKINPYNATTTGHFSVTVFGVSGALQGNADVSLWPSSFYTRPWVPITVDATVYNPGYLASAVWLESNTSGGWTQAASSYLYDVGWSNVLDNVSGGGDILLGDILSYNARYARWSHTWLGEGVFAFSATSHPDNGATDTDTLYITVDGTAPTTPASVDSTSHAPYVWSCNTAIDAYWSASSDNLSGVAGYAVSIDGDPNGDPGYAINAWGTSTTFYVSPAPYAVYYVHVRALDYSGNASGVATSLPYYVSVTTASPYCVAKMNSAFCTPSIGYTGTPQIYSGADDFHIRATDVINQKNGILFWSTSYAAFPFQGGTMCVGAPRYRTPQMNSGGNPASFYDCSGVFDLHMSHAFTQSIGMQTGVWYYCQMWYRDPADAHTTGLTDALWFFACQ
jgi:hypothetical protein